MRFEFTEEQEAFRSQVREFLARELPHFAHEMVPGEVRRQSREFSQRIAAEHWIGMSWPREYGGGGANQVQQMILTEELVASESPCGYHFTGERQVGPSLILRGTPEQQEQWLASIVNAESSFALGLSEPGAGSDLAAVATRAIRDNDDYVVNGQKIWTSGVHQADMIWLVVRTDPEAPKHRGISILLVDPKSEGISIRPLINMANEHHFNEVFFENVRVPANNRVGEENRGWYVLAEHLDFERSGIEMLVTMQGLHDRLLEFLRRSKGDPSHHVRRHQVAQLTIELAVGRLFCYRVAWQQSSGRIPNYEASVAKLFGTEWTQRVARSAISAGRVTAWKLSTDFEAMAAKAYMKTTTATIAGGTSEIQRNIIAGRGLGLPRG